MTQCPKCHLMFETAQKFCSICGSLTTPLEQDGAEELTAELRQPEKTPNPHKTRQFDARDLSAPATATPSEQPASSEDDAGTSDATPPPEVAAGSPPEQGGVSRWMRAAWAAACVLALVGAVASGYILGQRSEAAAQDKKDATIRELAASNQMLASENKAYREQFSDANKQLMNQVISDTEQCRDTTRQQAASYRQCAANNKLLAGRVEGLTTELAAQKTRAEGLTTELAAQKSRYEELAARVGNKKPKPAPGGRNSSRGSGGTGAGRPR